MMSEMQVQRIHSFKANKRGLWSLRIFLILFVLSLFAEFIANDKPLLIWYDGRLFFPLTHEYPETAFGGEFELEADYKDPFVADLIEEAGWMLWPPVRYSYDTINYALPSPAPSPPTRENILGTDDKGRDVLARLIYGFRISVLFGLALTITSSIIGITVGALMVNLSKVRSYLDYYLTFEASSFSDEEVHLFSSTNPRQFLFTEDGPLDRVKNFFGQR